MVSCSMTMFVAFSAYPVARTALGAPPPSVLQYVESIPTATGSPPSIHARGGGALPHAVAKRIEQKGGTDASALVRIATSPALGAAAAGLPKTTQKSKPGTRTSVSTTPPAASRPIESSVGGGFWLDTSARWELGGLIALLVATAGAATLLSRGRR